MRMTKDFASLSPSILARKGGARPAMRSQLQPSTYYPGAAAAGTEDDLGWNDMGHDVARSADVVPLDEGNRFRPMADSRPVAKDVPEVVRQREAIVEQFVATAPAMPAASAPIASVAAPLAPSVASRRSALAEGRRAAFTLRLDAERHLSLRLASTILNKSAQTLVTEALDRFLAEMPEVGALAGTIRKRS